MTGNGGPVGGGTKATAADSVQERKPSSLSELESVRGPLNLPIERDLHFKQKSLQELRDHYKEKGWAL